MKMIDLIEIYLQVLDSKSEIGWKYIILTLKYKQRKFTNFT